MIVDEIIGFGLLREFMEDDFISDIMVNGLEKIFIECFGMIILIFCCFINNV